MVERRPSDATGPEGSAEGDPPGSGQSSRRPIAETLRADASPRPPPARPPLPLLDVQSARRHKVTGEIGRGGMGAVLRLHDRALVRDVAMKVSEPASASQSDAIQHLMEEAQITGQLDHPNIVPIHDVGLASDGESVYFTMKLVRGATFTHLIEELHAHPWDDRAVERALQVFLKVCDALAFAHSRGVVHRDVKPDNVMVGSFGQVYLMDWGLAMLRDVPPEPGEPGHDLPPVVVSSADGARQEEAGTIAGTLEYMAPEQVWGRTEQIDRRTDVFGLGGILYHLLTGHGPNHRGPGASGPPRTLRPGVVPPPEEYSAWPSVPPELCRIAMKALAEKREARYQTVSELKDDIEEFLRGGGWFATRHYPAGSVIVAQGDVAEEAYMLTGGTCEVYKTAGESRFVLRRMVPGDVFGEAAILTGEVRTASVIAVTDVTVKVVTRQAFEREFGRRSWAGVFVHALAARFRDLDEQLASLRGGE